MQHHIPTKDLGPPGEAMAAAVSACVHCGLCLPACPTYGILGQEMDSPRGRIFLMKEVLEGHLPLADATPFVDRCLGCVACVPACPSGVAYGDLVTGFRMHTEAERRRPLLDRLARLLVLQSLPYPRRFRWAVRAGRAGKRLQDRIPRRWAGMMALLPAALPDAPPLPGIYPALGERRARVALLVGCVQQALAPEINWATLRVLARNGVETLIPRNQGCCGGLSLHAGASRQALGLARANLAAFPIEVDAIVTNAAGCGSAMQDYPLLFQGLPEEKLAHNLAGKVQDISRFLDRLGLEEAPALADPLAVAYHDACHLAYAQGVQVEPRRLLGRVGNLTLLEIPDNGRCCGSAGTYNLQHPMESDQLGQNKAAAILSTGAEAVVTGNIGCLVQIQSHLKQSNQPLPVYHTIQILDMAYKGAMEQ